ncbi:MAG: T9SS type B sorting domain-containing protein [Bacteroidia bacterium]
MIYNRWGEMVYKGSKNTKDWDGRFKNSKAIEGVYFYTLSAKSLSGQSFYRNGNITIVR